MKLLVLIPAILLAGAPVFGAASLTGFPFTDESLSYKINSPGGVKLGEAHLHAKHGDAGWEFTFSIDAGLSAYSVKDLYTSHANMDFCSTDFSREISHGAHSTGEKETIERSTETVERTTTTKGGGKSQFAVPDCVKDALTLMFYARREMGQGRVPSAQQMLLGGLYDTTMDYAGAQTIAVGGKQVETDKVVCNVKGPASAVQFDIYFARDPARTPLLFSAPLPVGRLTMELVR